MARILVADDDAEQVNLQRMVLEALGHTVETALSAPATLERLARSTPHLIVIDLRFPTAGDGMALIRGIRRTGYSRPVIVLSGWPDDLYGTPEEKMVSRIVVKGSVRELLDAIAGLLAG